MKEHNNYDSEFCGSLPIHLINVIQPYGALIVVNKEMNDIVQVSDNITTLLGRTPKEIIGTPVSDYFTQEPLSSNGPDKIPQVLSIRGKRYLGFIHNKPGFYIIEINLESEAEAVDGSFITVYQEIREAMPPIEDAQSLSLAAQRTASFLKKKSGFDKVMIYRFDELWNGHVIAEAMEPGMESYMNFTFPASDIPKPARDLYEKNAYRFIPDTKYQPVKLYPVLNPATHSFLDMSDCNVRGVSTVHLEYLANMHVSASMSTRIMHEGKLWGLIACHHRTPVSVNYKVCATFELISGLFSNKISTLALKEKLEFDTSMNEMYTSLVEQTYRTGNISASLLSDDTNLLGLFAAGGLVVSKNGDNLVRGTVPEPHDIEDILLWLQTRETDNIFATDSFSDNYDSASEYKEHASGLIAIPIDQENNGYILLFRPETNHVINWGGDPSTRITFEEDLKTYHPRFSFRLWRQQVQGVSEPWKKNELDMAENLQAFVRDYLQGRHNY